MKRQPKTKYLPHLVTVNIGKAPYLVQVEPAKEGVEFFRELRHSKMGEPGECAACANAYAGMEAGIGKLCFSFDSRFITIDRWKKTKQGILGIGKIWRHEQARFQDRFDRDKEGLLHSPEAAGKVILYPYPVRKSKTSGPSGKHTGGGPVRRIADHSSPKGSLRRSQRSGIMDSARGR